MKKLLILCVLAFPVLSNAGPYYELKNDTASGISTMSLSGVFGVAASSKTSTTYKIWLDGVNGRIGVGTTSPTDPIMVSRDSGDSAITITATAANSKAYLNVEGASTEWALGINQATGDSFDIANAANLNSGNFFTINSGGDISMGTSVSTTTFPGYVDFGLVRISSTSSSENATATCPAGKIVFGGGSCSTDKAPLLRNAYRSGSSWVCNYDSVPVAGAVVAEVDCVRVKQ